MYNYQTYLKQSKVNKKCDKIRRQYYEDLVEKQKTNPTLIHSHKKRIEGFILAMVEKPNPIVLYQDNHYEPRSLEKPRSIHQKSFHLAHQNEKSRIQQTSENNSICDPVPFHNTFSHRFRDFKHQSTLKPMRYSSLNSSLRVKQQLQSTTLNYLTNLKNNRIDKLVKNPGISWKDKGYVKQVNKSLLPFLHKKTYFQSLKSIFSLSPSGSLNPIHNSQNYQKENPISRPDEYVINMQFQEDQTDLDLNSKKQKKNNGQKMNRKQHSRQALVKCGLLAGKSTAYKIGMQKTSKRVFPNRHNRSQFINC